MINAHKRSIKGSGDKNICNKSDRVRSVHLEARVASVFVDSWKNIFSDAFLIKINKNQQQVQSYHDDRFDDFDQHWFDNVIRMVMCILTSNMIMIISVLKV